MSTLASARTIPAPTVPVARRRRRINPAYAFTLPAIGLLALVLLVPLGDVFYLSVQTDTSGGGMVFDGLSNYQRFLDDPMFWNAVRNTAIFAVGSVFLHLLLGMAAALLLNQEIVGRTVFRVIALVPWMFSSVVVAVLWNWMYSPQFGVINDILDRLGIHSAAEIAWLGDLNLALPAVIFANAWRGFPFVMIMILAGLQTIPREEYEASYVDGASTLAAFRFVTLPHLRFVIGIAVILDSIWTFRYFDLIQVMTRGGPANATEVLVTLVFRNSFEYFKFGYASAIAVITFLILLGFTLIYVRIVLAEERR